MPSDFSDYVIQYGLPIGTPIASLFWVLIERRGKLKEKIRADAAEIALSDNKRRAEGPKLRPTLLRCKSGHVQQDEVISVETPANSELKMDIINEGATIYEITDNWPDGSGFDRSGGTLPHAAEVSLVYRYIPAERGKAQRIKLRFVAGSGDKMAHVYEIIHGECVLRRIDPD